MAEELTTPAAEPVAQGGGEPTYLNTTEGIEKAYGVAGDTPAPVVETPPADPPKPFWERATEKYPDLKERDENFLIEDYGTARTKVAEYEAKVRELEGRKVSYPTQAAEELALFQQSLVDKGVTDAAEYHRQTLEFIEENSRDYKAMAEKDPGRLIEIALRKEYPNATPEQMAILLEDEGVRKAPDLADYSNDPDGADYKAAAEDFRKSQVRLQLKAANKAVALEAGKKKFDFQPKGVPTPEDIERQNQEVTDMYVAQINAFESNFKGVKVGDFAIDAKLEGALRDHVSNTVNNARAFVERFFDFDKGTYKLDAIMDFASKEYLTPSLLAQARAKANSEVVRQTEAELRNGGVPVTTGGGGATQGGGYIKTQAQMEATYGK